jgi:flagellar biogenesis protein FliO
VLEILPQLLAVLGVFGLLGFTLWWLRRRGMVSMNRKTGKQKFLKRVDALQLSPTHALSLVRMGERAVLIGTSPAGFYLVESTPWKALEGGQIEE